MSVVVVEGPPQRPSASWAGAGMLAPVTEAHYGEEKLLELNLESNRLYPGFITELEENSGVATGYRSSGTLIVARDADDNAELDRLFAFQERLGLEVERLRARDCRRLEPGLSPRVRGGIFVTGDHQVDNRALLEAAKRAGERRGVRRVEGTVASIDVVGDEVKEVSLEQGSIAAERVVVAAGCWSGSIAGVPAEARLPVRPVKGQLLHLRGPAELRLAQRNIRGLDVYVVPRADGRVVVGATVEEQGFDDSVTAGGVLTLLRDAYELLPGIVELELVETVAGLRPGTPDNAPLLGETSVKGLIAATGHFRNGILLTPVTAAGIAELLVTGEAPALAPFTPQRFAAAGARS